MSQHMDIAKKQLLRLDQFIEQLQQELVTLAQYTDVGPSRALYAHIRELIKDLLNTNSQQEFEQKFGGLNQTIAGLLIVIVPKVAGSVKRNMQKAHGSNFDPAQFDELIKGMNQNVKFNIPKDTTGPVDPSNIEEEWIEEDPVENDPEEAVKMIGLEDYVTKKPKAKPNDPNDTLGGVFKKYQ